MTPTAFDAIVVGAGLVGSAAAWRLAGRGSVLLLEQFELLHRRGSSHGGSRIFRHAYEDPRYVRLALAADEGWSELERDAGEKLLFRTGGLDLGPAGHPDLVAIERALVGAGRPVETLGPDDLRARFPAFRIPERSVGLFQRDAGILAADRCVRAMQHVAVTRGATVLEGVAVAGLDLRPDGVRVATSAGTFHAGGLVLAAGAWTLRLAELPLPLSASQQQVLYLRVPPGERFAPGRFPIFIDRESLLYGFPRFEHAAAIKVAHHATRNEVTAETRTFDADPRWAEETMRGARRLLPEVGELARAETCLYTMTPDEHFVVGTHPSHPRTAVAAGFSGHGFKFGPALGDAVADLVLEGATGHDLSLFALERFGAAGAA